MCNLFRQTWVFFLYLLFGITDACYMSENEKLAQGDKTYVCITVGGTDDATGLEYSYARFPFRPKMDDFTLLELEDSWTSESYASDEFFSKVGVPSGTVTTTSELWVHVESEGQYSYQKIYRADAKTFRKGVAVISVSNGKVDGITWDTGCFDCASSSCEKNTYTYAGVKDKDFSRECYQDDADCADKPENCSLQMFIVWSGTDKNGNYLMSQQMRLSNFKSGEIST